MTGTPRNDTPLRKTHPSARFTKIASPISSILPFSAIFSLSSLTRPGGWCPDLTLERILLTYAVQKFSALIHKCTRAP